MNELKRTDLFKRDIAQLLIEDRGTALYLLELVIAIQSNRKVLRKLHSMHKEEHVEYPEFDIDTWGEMMRSQGLSVWRISPQGTSKTNARNYRIIYSFDGKSDDFFLLGVMKRSNGYDDTGKPHTQEIIQQCHDLGLYIHSIR